MKVKIGNYFKSGKPRKAKVEIEGHDLYSLDHTLALIIHPCLVAYRANGNRGVPGNLMSENSGNEDMSYEDGLRLWNEILDKMIWSFNEIAFDSPNEPSAHDKAYYDRVQAGLDLFGYHYSSLWT